MKAIVCPTYGGPKVLQVKEFPKPIPKDGEVLVKVHSSTAVTGDCNIMSLSFAAWFRLPARFVFGFTGPRKQIPGWELSGYIESIGQNVNNFKVGDRVFGYTKGITFGGTNAEYKSIPENRLVSINDSNISFEEAAVLPIGGLTALSLLRSANVGRGQKVLVYGASGSVGTFAVQLAKLLGAEVTGVCSGGNVELVKSIGADIVIDYTKEDYTTNNQSYDVVFDAVGKTSFSLCKNSLVSNGIFLTVDWPFRQAIWALLTTKKKVIFPMAANTTEDLIFLKELVEKGEMKPVIDRTFSLDEAVEAYSYVEKGHKKGNVVIAVAKNNTE
ncbi:NAD(P)-dependent alcohol dehydrogenase [Ulvibacterium sp.]|uniref:NAD(P)-dependent alcohol dehydrogenase n=1 Tax=Ulvibacterium sp. TaxID=2665914 RepID=UPI003BACEEAF